MSLTRIKITFDKTYSWAEKAFVLLIVLSPILQHYKGLFVNGGVTALLLAMPYVLIKLIKKQTVSSWAVVTVMPIIPFMIFKVIDHGTYLAEFGQAAMMIIYMLAFSAGLLDSKLLIHTAVRISCLASIIMFIQYICYYILRFHLQIVPVSLLKENSAQWVKLAQTGTIGITGRSSGFYRPSAFFLEPSHLFLFVFPCLLFTLLNPVFGKEEKRKSILLALGIILSTSGMGILVVFATLLVFLAKRGGRKKDFALMKLFLPQNFVLLFGMIIIVALMFSNVSFFRQSLLRLISTGNGQRSAVTGRVARANSFIKRMQGIQLLIGISDRYEDIEFNMSGFNGTVYKYGIIGTILSYIFYLKSVIYLRYQYFWIAAVIIVISFFTAHTHGTFYMLYFMIFLINGFREKRALRVGQSSANLTYIQTQNSSMM